MRDEKWETLKDIGLFVSFIAILSLIACGCASKTRHMDLDGLYASETGTIAIGSIEVQSAPEGVESAMVTYEDSVAWLSDKKNHRVRVLLTGTNSCSHAEEVVSSICDAFKATAPSIVWANDTTNTVKEILK